MCGIGGIIKLERQDIDLAGGAQLISQTLRHRGPDDEGYLFFEAGENLCAYGNDTQKNSIQNSLNYSAQKHIENTGNNFEGVLVHRRLSIIDLSETGHQPMCTADKETWLTFNGEIYNYIELRKELKNLGHSFRTESDTEVILAAYRQWGNDCVKHFNGMFAFAIYDKVKNKIFCARDISGVKPFYYYFKNGVFCFASELKALRSLPFVETSLNERALHHYLVYDAIEYEPEGFLKNVFELFPSHYLELDLSSKKIALVKYIHIKPNNAFSDFNIKDFEIEKERTRELVTDSILKRLRADVAVGCCLSGGIDSSVISGVIGKNHPNFKAFTAAFPGEKIDESKFAKEAAEFSNAEWHKTTPTAEELAADFDELVYALDVPIWSTSTYAQFRVMKLAKKNNVKVVLDGQGGDELFAGYPHYYTTYLNELLKNAKIRCFVNELNKIKNGFGVSYLKENLKRRIKYNSNRKYIHRDFLASYGEPANTRYSFDGLNEHLKYDFFDHRLKTYLRCEDRCGMWHSVESRTPFADDAKLIGYSLQLPSAYKIKNGVSKYILRESMRDFLPFAVYNRHDKMGFITPHNDWMHFLYQTKAHTPEVSLLKSYFSDRIIVKTDHLQSFTSKGENSLFFKSLVFTAWRRLMKI